MRSVFGAAFGLLLGVFAFFSTNFAGEYIKKSRPGWGKCLTRSTAGHPLNIATPAAINASPTNARTIKTLSPSINNENTSRKTWYINGWPATIKAKFLTVSCTRMKPIPKAVLAKKNSGSTARLYLTTGMIAGKTVLTYWLIRNERIAIAEPTTRKKPRYQQQSTTSQNMKSPTGLKRRVVFSFMVTLAPGPPCPTSVGNRSFIPTRALLLEHKSLDNYPVKQTCVKLQQQGY